MVEFKFHAKLPIFVARQWIRHRMSSTNEYSGRYSVMKDEFYIQLKYQPEAKPVMKATIDDKEHVLGWTYERPESKGGRSFGFVCGHFHVNFGEKPP